MQVRNEAGYFSLMVKVQGQQCTSHLQSYNLYRFTVLGSQNMNAKTAKIMFFTGDHLHCIRIPCFKVFGCDEETAPPLQY